MNEEKTHTNSGKIYLSEPNAKSLAMVGADALAADAITMGDVALAGTLPALPHRVSTANSNNYLYARTLGKKQYEITDHLGNVRATISDRRFRDADNNTYYPELLSTNTYYPFGMGISSLSVQGGYRFGFGGHEKDNEWAGSTGRIYTTDFRQYDASLGRWFSVDPLADLLPGITSYHYCYNSPMNFIDPDGMWVQGAGFFNNIFKRDERNKAEMKAETIKNIDGISDVEVKKTGKRAWRVSWSETNNGVDFAKGTIPLKGVGFVDYIFKNSNTNILEHMDQSLQSLYGKYKNNSVGEYMEKGDKFMKMKALPVFVKVFPPTAQIDAGVTIATGKDVKSTSQEGALNRYILPGATLTVPLVKGLNAGGVINLSDKAVKSINRADRLNTFNSVGQEIKKQIEND